MSYFQNLAVSRLKDGSMSDYKYEKIEMGSSLKPTKNWTNKMDSNWGYIKGGADYALCYWDSTGYVANFVFNWYLYEHYGGLEFLGRVMRAPREQEPRCNYTIQNLDYLRVLRIFLYGNFLEMFLGFIIFALVRNILVNL